MTGLTITLAQAAACGFDLSHSVPKKGLWVVLDADDEPVAVLLTKGLARRQQAVAKSVRLRREGRFSTTLAVAWKDHNVAVVFAECRLAAFLEAAHAVAPVPFPSGAVWMEMV